MSEHQAHLLARIEHLTETDRRTADDIAARLAAQTTGRLSRWLHRHRLGRLPHQRPATEAV
ncbi:hypothetical protein [Tenggerimyces flavus]|uniref:Uncharacterized protein n=1 Tax=Tenggerimyces flavus TaxID=1708749 RepID=A0ABV7Y6T9_9ACTN|nr:hypothetical protein [Tenggerimyces flavus]MBM7791083.1 hypothetical protein [Tenggerimyces flavus]